MDRKGLAMVLLAGILWGGVGVFAKGLSAVGCTSMQIVAIRALVAFVTLALIVAVKKPSLLRIHLKDLWMFLGTGIVSFVLFNWCYFTAIEVSSICAAAVLLYTSPVFVAIFSIFLFRETWTKRKTAALALTVAGCALVSGILGGGVFSWAGIAAGLGSGFAYALYSIFGRYALKKYHPLTLTVYTFAFAILGVLPFADYRQVFQIIGTANMILPGVALGILCSAAPFLLYTEGLNHMETSKAAILVAVEPVASALLGIFIYHEPITLGTTAGIFCVVASILLLNWTKKKKV